MAAIVTITLNPALDKSLSIPKLVADKKLKCSAAVCEPGGGGINVARAIKKLGGNALAVYLSGGDTGKKITRLLAEESVESMPVNISESTRENLVIADLSDGKQYLFDMPGPAVSEQEWQQCLDAVEQIPGIEYIIASGSLPPGVPTDIFARIALIARRKNAKLVVDTSGPALRQALQAGVYLVKPNLKELASLVGKEDLDKQSAAEVAREIIGYGNCEVVIVSMGAEGAMLVTEELVVNIKPPALKIKSTVGAGDSLLAGVVLSLAAGKNLPTAVEYGVACGAAATINPGTELCTKTNADHIYGLIHGKGKKLAPSVDEHSELLKAG